MSNESNENDPATPPATVLVVTPDGNHVVVDPVGIARAAHVQVLEDAATQDSVAGYFAYAHLPPNLAAISRQFAELAAVVVATLPRNPERTVALRKLLEGKDAAVRAALTLPHRGKRDA